MLKENGMAGIMRTLRAYDNPLKMLHASVMGIPMLFIWDPEGTLARSSVLHFDRTAES